MTIRSTAIMIASLAAVFSAAPAPAQTMVEAAGASAAASGSAGALKSLGDTINGALGNANETLKTADTTTTVVHTSSPSSKTRSRKSKYAVVGPVLPPPPKPQYEDPLQIKSGIGYDEMIRRFGPPALTWTDGSASTMITYLSKVGPIQLEFAGGKITTVQKPQM